jgi:hypothetical protein
LRALMFRIGKGCAGGGMASVEDGSEDPSLEPRHRMIVCRLTVRELHPSIGVFGRLPDSVSAVMADVLRKEVIQPQVPLRLPCYDFTPVADLTVDGCILAVCAPA